MADHLSDAILLDRFVTHREEEAFAVLVRRHGPRVLAACRSILPSEHDAEDVVQATFLVLALKAADVAWRESVGGWLCEVARRLSMNARAGALRRNRREVTATTLAGGPEAGYGAIPEEFHPRADPLVEITRRDLRRVLDDELNLLPEKYRAPVVLCDLEGMTHEEAARRLGWPSGSISRRLGHARALLRERLVGRGIPVAVALLFGVILALRLGGYNSPRRDAGADPVRLAMAPFKAADDGGQGLQCFLDRLGRGDRPSSRREAVRVAREVARLAERVEGHVPDWNEIIWRAYAGDMKRSALGLTRAAEGGDETALVAAVRKVNESCVQCHLVFRPKADRPPSPLERGPGNRPNPRKSVSTRTEFTRVPVAGMSWPDENRVNLSRRLCVLGNDALGRDGRVPRLARRARQSYNNS